MLRSYWKTCNGLLEIRQITAGAGVNAAGALDDRPAGAGHRVGQVRGIYGEEVMGLCLAYHVHGWVSKTFTLFLKYLIRGFVGLNMWTPWLLLDFSSECPWRGGRHLSENSWTEIRVLTGLRFWVEEFFVPIINVAPVIGFTPLALEPFGHLDVFWHISPLFAFLKSRHFFRTTRSAWITMQTCGIFDRLSSWKCFGLQSLLLVPLSVIICPDPG